MLIVPRHPVVLLATMTLVGFLGGVQLAKTLADRGDCNHWNTLEKATSAANHTTTDPPFHQMNPNPHWCPYATCQNSPRCQPCQRRFLIEIATGRSGSTSLMHMLDLLPNLRMAGENNNQLHAIYKMIQNIAENKIFRGVQKTQLDGPWRHGYVSDGDLSCPAQSMIHAINGPSKETQEDPEFDDSQTILGFKTIRFLDKKWSAWNETNSTKELATAVDFVKKYFPCSRVVVNIDSNVTRQAQSAWYGAHENASETLLSENQQLKTVADLFGERAFFLDLQEWSHPVRGIDKMNQLIRWLGYQDCEFQRLVHDNEGGITTNFADTDKTQFALGPNCRYIGDDS